MLGHQMGSLLFVPPALVLQGQMEFDEGQSHSAITDGLLAIDRNSPQARGGRMLSINVLC